MKRNEILGERFDREDDEGYNNKRDFKRQELQHELGHEENHIQVVINGKRWKVIPGRGRADSTDERQNLQKMKAWADRKSAETGKKWEVYLTGASPSIKEMTPTGAPGQPEKATIKSVDAGKQTATLTGPTGDKEVPMKSLTQNPAKPGELVAQVDAADPTKMKPGAPVTVTTVAESMALLRKITSI